MTTTSITAVKVSILSAQSTFNAPEVNQLPITETLAGAVPSATCDEDDPGQDGADKEKARRDEFGRAVADPPAEGAGDQKSEQRQKNDGCIHGKAQPFIRLMSSIAIEPRLR